MYAMQQSSGLMLLKYFCAYTLTRCIRVMQNSLEHMRGEEQTENILLDLLIFITLLVQLDGGIHGPIETEDEDELIKEVCETGCECSPCIDKKAVPEAVSDVLPEVAVTKTLPELAASEAVPEVTSEQPKIVLKAVRVADKREECCVIS